MSNADSSKNPCHLCSVYWPSLSVRVCWAFFSCDRLRVCRLDNAQILNNLKVQVYRCIERRGCTCTSRHHFQNNILAFAVQSFLDGLGVSGDLLEEQRFWSVKMSRSLLQLFAMTFLAMRWEEGLSWSHASGVCVCNTRGLCKQTTIALSAAKLRRLLGFWYTFILCGDVNPAL